MKLTIEGAANGSSGPGDGPDLAGCQPESRLESRARVLVASGGTHRRPGRRTPVRLFSRGRDRGRGVIIVRVELWPRGDPRSLRQIAILGITNVGPGEGGLHAYEVRSEGRVARLRHYRADGALALVARSITALAEAEPDALAERTDEDRAEMAVACPSGFRPAATDGPDAA